ncbi:hypothetical protein OSTOST_04643 [Ostertagia ostertagi]
MGPLFLVTTNLLRRSPVSLRCCSTVLVPLCSAPNTEGACDDNRLINREDFRGVTPRNEKQFVREGLGYVTLLMPSRAVKNRRRERSRFPETVLSRIQESLRKNYRISASTIFLEVVKRLEEGDGESICFNAQTFIRAMASHAAQSMWKCLVQCSKLIPTANFSTVMEAGGRKRYVTLTSSSVYEMARRGFLVNNACNDALVYCFAVRGHHAKADSLAEQALGKYGADAVSSAQGACAKAAAARAGFKPLEEELIHMHGTFFDQVLRRAVMGTQRKLILSSADVLETIWLLAEKSRDGDGSEYVNLTEQMLDHTNHEAGFFRLLIREVERHISHQHYYTAVALLEDTNRIADCLKNQQKSLFLDQMIAQLSRQVIRNEVNVVKLNDIANRVVAIFQNHPNAPRIHDDLFLAVVMYKDFSIDKRMEYVNALLDMVDRDRTRPHIMLPLLASAEDVDERLKLIFRCCNAGYKDLSQLDISVLTHLVLQPLYDKQRISSRGDQTKLDKMARILRSFGVGNDSIWQTMYAWWQDRSAREKRMASLEYAPRPYARELQGWLRQHYTATFEVEKKSKAKSPPIRDSSKVHAFLSSYGWPEDTNYEEIVPDVLGLYLDHEEWGNVKKMLKSLSAQSGKWQKENDPSYCPVQNYHLLQILRRRANEGDEISLRKLISYAFELRRLFPGGACNISILQLSLPMNTFFNTMHEYNRLFGKCFGMAKHQAASAFSRYFMAARFFRICIRSFSKQMGKMLLVFVGNTGITMFFFQRLPNPSVEKIDECIDLLRTLIKLEILQLHPNETLTCVFIGNVLRKLGWEEAVNTWMKFQSGLYCSNGIVALLLYCLGQKSDNQKRNIQYVLHKAQNFLHQSRVHCLYAAVLVAKRYYEEAATFLEEHKEEIDPLDCVMAMRFMNSFKAKMVDEEFIRQFAELCLKHTKFNGNAEAVRQMQVDWIRTCGTYLH